MSATNGIHDQQGPAQPTTAVGADVRSGRIPVQGPDFAPGIEGIFASDFPELDGPLAVVDGAIPNFVRGTYYLNGPARFAIGNFVYRHWLDGDGMVTRLHFDGKTAHLTNRYVRSTKFAAEQKEGRPLFRAFGTAFEGSRLNNAKNGLESPVNVSVYPFGKMLLAFGEQGLPWELDPQTLETRGKMTFNERMNDASPFSAHAKFDPDTEEMMNFGIFFSPQAPKLYFYTFGREGLRRRKAIPLEYPCSIHDFALSKNYAVFYLGPYLLDPGDLTQRGLSVMDSLHWEPHRGSRLLVVSRSTGEAVASIPIGSAYCLHLISAFEQEGDLVADVLEFDGPIYRYYQPVPDLYRDVPRGGPVRFIVNLQDGELRSRCEIKYRQSPDFPAMDMRLAMKNYEDFWMLGLSHAGNSGRKFFDHLAHANWLNRAVSDIYQCRPLCYLGGEPVFIPEPGRPGGAILCQEFDAATRRTCFLLFDAMHVCRGPIARLAIEQPFYLGFHATFLPECQD